MTNNNLEIKAQENYKTAEWAEQEKYYDVAVSRYYYSAYQKIICISKRKKFYKDFSGESDSHNKMIKHFSEKLNHKLDGEDIIILNNIQRLRRLRNDSDYSDKKIETENDFNLMFKFAYNNINEVLNKLL